MKKLYTILLLLGNYFAHASGTETLLTYNLGFDSADGSMYAPGYFTPVSSYIGNNQMLTACVFYNYNQANGFVTTNFRVLLHDLNGTTLMNTKITLDTNTTVYPQIYDVGKIAGGGYYIYAIQQADPNNQNLSDLILIKLNNDGTMAWNSKILMHDFPSSSQSHIKVRTNSNGDFFLNGVSDHGLTVCMVSSAGDFVWGKILTYDSTGVTKSTMPDITGVNDSTLILTASPTYSDNTYVSVNTNTGVINWAKDYTTDNFSTPTVTIPTSDGNVATGTSAYPTGTILWKLDLHGNVLWRKAYNVPGQNMKMIELNDGTLMVAASTLGTAVTLMHLDAVGNILEKKVVLGATYVNVSELVKDGNDFVLTANVVSAYFKNPYMIVVKASAIGDLCETLNTPVTATNPSDTVRLQNTEAGLVIHDLYTDNSSPYTADNTVAYTVDHQDYCSYVLPVNTVSADAEAEVFPIPATSEINIRLTETPTGSSTLKLFDINGNLVMQQNLQQKQTVLSVSHLPSGVYLTEIKNSQGTFTRRVVKM